MNAENILERSPTILRLGRSGVHTLQARAGTLIVCLSGSITLKEGAAGFERAGIAPSVPLHTGQTHLILYGGQINIAALQHTEFLCIAPKRLWEKVRKWAFYSKKVAPGSENMPLIDSCAAQTSKLGYDSFIRRGVEQSGSSSGS